MGEGIAGKASGIKVIPNAAGTAFKSNNNTGGEAYAAGTNSVPVDGADSWQMPTSWNMLDVADFSDTSVDNLPGMKTGEWSASGNYHQSGQGLEEIQDAHDSETPIELAMVADEATVTTGYECTVYVSELNISSEANGKVTFDATFVFADGDGWSRLQT
jgi:hypothetical protein